MNKIKEMNFIIFKDLFFTMIAYFYYNELVN